MEASTTHVEQGQLSAPLIPAKGHWHSPQPDQPYVEVLQGKPVAPIRKALSLCTDEVALPAVSRAGGAFCSWRDAGPVTLHFLGDGFVALQYFTRVCFVFRFKSLHKRDRIDIPSVCGVPL